MDSVEEKVDGASVALYSVDCGRAVGGRIVARLLELIHSLFVNQLETTSAAESNEVSPTTPYCSILSYTSRAAMLLPQENEDLASCWLPDRCRFDDCCAVGELVFSE